MNERLNDFLNLSAALTGFERLHLIGTGVASEYLETVDRVASPAIVDRLLQAYKEISAGEGQDEQIASQILDDSVLGPVARNTIVLWYTGTWTPLPAEWCEVNGFSTANVGHVVSSAAYLSGLQWVAAGAHPPGGLPPGFASWASPPLGVEQ